MKRSLFLLIALVVLLSACVAGAPPVADEPAAPPQPTKTMEGEPEPEASGGTS